MVDNTVDEEAVRELDQYWSNDFSLYQDFTRNFMTYLNNKYIKKEYDREKAVKLLSYFVERIRAKYKKENGLGTLNAATKKKLAEEIRDYYEAEFQPHYSDEKKAEVVKSAKKEAKEHPELSRNEAAQVAIDHAGQGE